MITCAQTFFKMSGKETTIDSPENNNNYYLKENKFRRTVHDILEPRHDDQFLQKWLIARNFDLIKAEKMIRESFVTHKKFGLDSILTDFKLPEVWDRNKVTTSLGFDKGNNAGRVFMAGIWDCKGNLQSMDCITAIKIFAYFMEYDLKKMEDMKREGQETDMKCTFVVDFTEFSLKKFYDKQVIKLVIQLLKLLQDIYPELIKTIFLVNVPSYSTYLFSIFKPFLSEATLSKLKIHNTDEYQDELRTILDPKQIPVFLGGDLTSPDGDPKCPHLLDWNTKIDPSFFLVNIEKEEDPSMKTVTVQKREVLKIPIEVQTSPVVLKWVFMSKKYNIRFGLFFRRGGKSSSLEELIPLENVDCHVMKEQNKFICKKTGTYILHFDNSNSWMTSKQISYKVELEKIDPNDIIDNELI